MELNRLIRVLGDRWRIVVILALIGLVAAIGFTTLANRTLDSTFEAVIPIRFDPSEGETVEDLANEVNDARDLAAFAAEDLLAADPDSSIFADTGSGRLFFLAPGATRDEALEKANELLQAYLGTDPLAGGNIDDKLLALEEDATELQASIDALQPAFTAGERSLISQHDLLDQQKAAIEATIVGLSVAEATATAAEQEQNAAELERLEQIRADLELEKAVLAPRPTGELSPANKLQLDALQRRFDLLRIEYERLALRKLGVTSGGGTQEQSVVTDRSPTAASPLRNGVVGLIGGMGLALFAVAFVTRTRGEFWLPEDLPVPVLAEVPNRKVSSLPGPPWYDSVGGGRRKESIQALRNSLEGAVDSDSAALAVIADHVDSATSHALAMDLATAFASAGRSVLIVDADYSEPAMSTEYNVGEPTLESILSMPAGPPDLLRRSIDSALSEAVHIRPDLAVMSAGAAPRSPADAVAGSQFRVFLERANDWFDLVLVVAGNSKSPGAQVVAQRVGDAFISVMPGRSTSSGVGSLVTDLTHQKVTLLGAVAIHGHERRLSLPRLSLRPWRRGKPEAPPSAAATGRLSRYPFPGSKTSGVVTGGTMKELADNLAEADVVVEMHEDLGMDSSDPLASEVLDAITRSQNGRAYTPIASYVVARVEDMMTAVPGQANVSSGTLDVILEYGFVPFINMSKHASIGERLVVELMDELGDDAGQRLAEEFARILGGSDANPALTLNGWIAREFFSSHVERTEGEPEVWHITSENGTVQLLVSGRRLTQETIDKINVDVVRRSLDSYQRALMRARESGDTESMDPIEEKLREIHLFEISLGLLQVGASDEARLYYPWRASDEQPQGWDPVWTEGIHANIAPLQRLGLLAAPVLSEKELTLDHLTT